MSDIIEGTPKRNRTITIRYRSMHNTDKRITGTVTTITTGERQRIYVASNREPPSVVLEEQNNGWFLLSDIQTAQRRIGVVTEAVIE